MIKMFFSQSSLLFLSSLLTFFYLILSSNAAAQLPTSEVQALRDIAKALGKTNWNFDVDPCSGESGWFTKNPDKGFNNSVSCNCSFSNATVCHVTSMLLGLDPLAPERSVCRLGCAACRPVNRAATRIPQPVPGDVVTLKPGGCCYQGLNLDNF